jgi:hypothetical protein
MDTKEEEKSIITVTAKMILNVSIFPRRNRAKNFIGLRFNLHNIDICKIE